MTALHLPHPVPYINLDFEKQSVEVPGTKRPGQTGHYRNASHPFVTVDSPNTVRNLLEVFENGLFLAGPDAPCLGQRKLISSKPVVWSNIIEWQSWGTVDARRRALGSGIYKLFEDGAIGGGTLRTVGIWSKNAANWHLIDLSLHLFHLVNVALYDTLGKDSVEYVINHSDASIIFASAQNIPTLLQLSAHTPCLRLIVAMEALDEDVKSIFAQWGQSRNIKIMELSEVEALGEAQPAKPLPPSSEAIATICYTSGTTGVPKGAILTQGAMAIAAHSLTYGTNFRGDPVLEFSYLPLAHIFERIVGFSALAAGGSIGFGSGDPLRLVEDMQLIRPTLIPSVPRVMNRVVAAAMATSKAGGLKAALFNRALAAKLAAFHQTGEMKHAFWDRLVFSKIQAILGGRLRVIGLGSAPMNPTSVEFLKIALCCDIIEGYGSTENCGAASRAISVDHTSAGTVGPPGIALEWKLVDVPSLGYSSEDKPNPRGEICTRGTTNFKGYFKDEVNTQAALDEEGWFHTGDVGEFDSKGRFKIIDRVKNIMKLAQGEYVAVEKVESLYSASPVVGQLLVYGDSLQSYLIAVLVPDPVQLAAVASKVSGVTIAPDDLATLQKATQDPEVTKALFAELDREAEKNALKGFERIKRLLVNLSPFSVEEGTMTPTFKLRRKDAFNKFKREIDALYALGEPNVRSQL